MARTVEDILARRVRVLFLDAIVAMEMAPAVAQLMAAEMNRDDTWAIRQVEAFAEVASGYTLADD